MQSDSIKEIAQALAAAQLELSPAKKNQKNPYFKSSYADLAACFEAIREVFAKQGLSVSQPIVTRDGQMCLVTLLMHTSGEFIRSEMMLPPIPDPQKLGGCITYFRRYALQSIAGLPVEDDDGNSAAQAVKSNTKSLVNQINDLPDLKADIEGWLTTQNIPLDKVPVSTYNKLMDRIMKERARLHGIREEEDFELEQSKRG